MASPDQEKSIVDSPALELASNQAALAFERTLMSADRTLMGAIQTSLALIGFGFAMVLFFHQVSSQIGVNLRTPARNFGIFLVSSGIALITIGLIDHRRHLAGLRTLSSELQRKNLLVQGMTPRRSYTAILALLLLMAGLLVIMGILVRIGPFG
jgi:putative membrane protein